MNENKMAIKKIKPLLWSMGLPMVFSMVLQALYNVVDIWHIPPANPSTT